MVVVAAVGTMVMILRMILVIIVTAMTLMSLTSASYPPMLGSSLSIIHVATGEGVKTPPLPLHWIWQSVGVRARPFL